MRLLSSLLVIGALAPFLSCCSPVVRSRSVYAVKDVHSVPRVWVRGERAPPDHEIHLQVGLKQGRFDELERHLYEGD